MKNFLFQEMIVKRKYSQEWVPVKLILDPQEKGANWEWMGRGLFFFFFSDYLIIFY